MFELYARLARAEVDLEFYELMDDVDLVRDTMKRISIIKAELRKYRYNEVLEIVDAF